MQVILVIFDTNQQRLKSDFELANILKTFVASEAKGSWPRIRGRYVSCQFVDSSSGATKDSSRKENDALQTFEAESAHFGVLISLASHMSSSSLVYVY
ncbi:hypothetical protein TNCV_2309551 [Trichonephila clavipes]|nr:hypothetical protein TNCV_2309551 [Trichonephila clavipes]